MPLINNKINLILTRLANCVITDSVGVGTFAISDTKRNVLVVILSIEENAKLFKQINFGFKCTITWFKSLIKVTVLAQNQYFDFLIDPSFLGVNRVFFSI